MFSDWEGNKGPVFRKGNLDPVVKRPYYNLFANQTSRFHVFSKYPNFFILPLLQPSKTHAVDLFFAQGHHAGLGKASFTCIWWLMAGEICSLCLLDGCWEHEEKRNWLAISQRQGVI